LSFSSATSPWWRLLEASESNRLSNGCGHFSDGTQLIGQVGSEKIHVAREIFPRTAAPGYVRLAAQFALDANFAGKPLDLVGERKVVATRMVMLSDGF